MFARKVLFLSVTILNGCSSTYKAPTEVVVQPTLNREIKIVKSEPLSALSAIGTSGFACSESKYTIRWCLTQFKLNQPVSMNSKFSLGIFFGSTLGYNRDVLKSEVPIVWPLECVTLRETISDYKTCRSDTHYLLPLNPFNFLEKVNSYEHK